MEIETERCSLIFVIFEHVIVILMEKIAVTNEQYENVSPQGSWIYPHDWKISSSSKSFNLTQVVGDGWWSEGWDSVLHFLFLLFRAFHSPSWVAKLPKSSFTFLFLSASLKHGARNKLEAFTNRSVSQTHAGLEAVSYPDLFMTSLSFSLARKRESFLISLRAPLNSFLYLCFSRSFSRSSLVLPRFFP